MYSESREISQKKHLNLWQKIFHRRKKRLFTDNEKEFQRYLNCFNALTFVYIISGVFFASFSFISLGVSRIILSFLFLFCGFLHIYFYFRRNKLSLFKLSILYGLFYILLGIVTMVFSNINILGCMAIFLMGEIVEKLVLLLYIFRLRDLSGFFLLVSIGLSLFMIVLLFINPFDQLLIREVLGIFMVFFAILNLTNSSFINKKIEGILSFFD